MRRPSFAIKMVFCLLFLCTVVFTATAQQGQPRPLPSDAGLLALVNKYIHTPVSKTTRPNGDVFLQRDLTPYLQATVLKSPVVSPADRDYGHDHKDEMLRTFLARPQPSVATLNKYFTDAATEFGVPVVILKAAAQVQSNWAQVSESIYGSWGIMGLVENGHVQQIGKRNA